VDAAFGVEPLADQRNLFSAVEAVHSKLGLGSGRGQLLLSPM
jgi:hypothetical protein